MYLVRSGKMGNRKFFCLIENKNERIQNGICVGSS